MSTILIVGDSFYTLRDYLVEHGYKFVVLQDVHRKAAPKRFSEYVTCDFSDWDSVTEALKTLQKNFKIDGVVSIYENYVLPAARIAKELNLPGLPIEAARACTDKFLMRQKFAQAKSKISPAFQLVNDMQSLKAFADKHGFPLIIKPTNLAKSLLVTKSDNMDALIANYRNTLTRTDATYRRYAPYRQPKLIVEEYMEGSTHSIDAFVDHIGQVYLVDAVVDYQTAQEVGFDDYFHYSRLLPSQLDASQLEAIHDVAINGCQALGMRNSPAHIEIILTNEGPRIVEIGARNGGYRERMHLMANGIDIIGNALHVALKKPINITPLRHDCCAVIELFPKKPGIFREVTNLNQLRQLKTFVSCDLKVGKGQIVGRAADGYKMCAIIILHTRDAFQFQKDLSFIRERIHVVTD